MTPLNMSTKVKENVSSFIYLHSDISKNMLLSNVYAFNMLSNNDDNNINFENILLIAPTTNETWIQHSHDRF